MFLSIKWKALLFLSVILLMMTFGWLLNAIDNNVKDLKNQLAEKNHRQQLLLDQILAQDFFKISQFGQLIIKSPAVYQSNQQGNQPNLQNFLIENFFDWNLNLSLDYLAILKEGQQILADVGQTPVSNELNRIRQAYLPYQDQALKDPLNLVFCSDSCIQLVMEPFLFDDGQQGVIVVGQNMSEIVFRFAHITSDNLAILLGVDKPGQTVPEDLEDKLWALSNYQQTLPELVKLYQQKSDGEYDLWSLTEQTYFYKELLGTNYIQIGTPLLFLAIHEERSKVTFLKQEVKRGVLTSLFIFLLAEILLFLLVLGPLKRILKIVTAQTKLPDKKYDSAISLVTRKKPFFRDELSSLEQSTINLAEELKFLDDELSCSQSELAEKVQDLTRSKAFLQRLFDNANLLIAMLDDEQRIVTQNTQFTECFTAGVGSDFLTFFLKQQDKGTLKEGLRQLIDKQLEDFHHETTMLDKNHKAVTVVWTHALVTDELGQNRVLSIGVDITLRRQHEEKLYWLSHHDALTKTANRKAFQDKLNDMLLDNESGALVVIDISQFKHINDLYGHSIGDKVLIDVSNKLKESIRDDDFVCRFSGDEFMLILPKVHHLILMKMMASLQSKLNGTVETQKGVKVDYETCMGAVSFPENGTSEQSLVTHADMALYHAKKKDLDKWHIYQSSDDSLNQLKAEKSILGLIKKALKEHLFMLNFQPTLSIRNAEVNHYEALLRLNFEDGKPCSPGIFIPIAEKFGFIRQIDYWVIERVFQQLTTWLPDNPDLSIALNISAPTIQDQDFYRRFIDLNQTYEIPFDAITLELTETAYIENFDHVFTNLTFLREKGVKIALDDFGVGYSSFNYLRQLPLDYVKLDGSYVSGVAYNSENEAFIRSVAIMAEEFDMQIIAEFVENREDLSALIKLGVSYAQGYLIGRPQKNLLTQAQIQEVSALVSAQDE